MAAASVGAVHATPPASMGEEMSIVKVQEKGHTFVKGRVIDSEGNPLVWVTVKIEGTSYGVITDADGNYILEFPSMSHPKIENHVSGTLITIYRNVGVNGTNDTNNVGNMSETNVGNMSETNLTERQRFILSSIKKNPEHQSSIGT